MHFWAIFEQRAIFFEVQPPWLKGFIMRKRRGKGGVDLPGMGVALFGPLCNEADTCDTNASSSNLTIRENCECRPGC